ncbi:tyrosine-protein phosphatase [Glaciihabitans arcticus]|uniref:Tyrosine-protein phosphatase n=1 Tax=Glaciihabitans arcticus TaxID=2668039 RepID=A0A4Q9GSW5_9MICO|nr:tyrosine-protein phosphatase [Glaciihabitans arcticus]TBN56718.1 tyrosine-protein phosphatase [Glaciihabitans arcticus]
MHWDGALNLRDLGGLPLVAGGASAPGRVFRSGAPEWMTTLGWQQAAAAGLRTIVDLRNADEVGRRPYHPEISESARDPFTVISTPTEDPADDEFMAVCGPWLDHPRSYADNLRFYPARFAAVFRAIAGSPGVVLVHCSGGKDRTGLVSALLLILAGVERAAILDDYEAAFRAANTHLAEHPHLARHFAETPEALDEWVADRRDAFDRWLADFDVTAYLRAAGLDDTELDALQDRLTVS